MGPEPEKKEVPSEYVYLDTGEIVKMNQLPNGWISVEERLPDEGGEYLVTYSGLVELGTFLGYGPDKVTPRWSISMVAEYSFPTHWMPLPEPPEE